MLILLHSTIIGRRSFCQLCKSNCKKWMMMMTMLLSPLVYGVVTFPRVVGKFTWR